MAKPRMDLSAFVGNPWSHLRERSWEGLTVANRLSDNHARPKVIRRKYHSHLRPSPACRDQQLACGLATPRLDATHYTALVERGHVASKVTP
jgi:hypothetical protein